MTSNVAPNTIRRTELWHLHGRQQASDQGQHQRSRRCAEITSFAAGQQCAADSDRCDRRKEKGIASANVDNTSIPDHQKATKPGEHPGEGVCSDDYSSNANTGETCRSPIRADGKEVSAI
jgi:hypothetical protein